MAGRGDNYKSGSSGRGASNQSNQPFGQSADRGKSSSGKLTGGKPSQPQKKTADQSSGRNTTIRKEED
ncbi:MAG: hypothetical protein ACM3VS_18590 [Candidatus Dadabacteria bacterium]